MTGKYGALLDEFWEELPDEADEAEFKSALAALLEKAIAAERASLAALALKLADQFNKEIPADPAHHEGYRQAMEDIAAAIRAKH